MAVSLADKVILLKSVLLPSSDPPDPPPAPPQQRTTRPTTHNRSSTPDRSPSPTWSDATIDEDAPARQREDWAAEAAAVEGVETEDEASIGGQQADDSREVVDEGSEAGAEGRQGADFARNRRPADSGPGTQRLSPLAPPFPPPPPPPSPAHSDAPQQPRPLPQSHAQPDTSDPNSLRTTSSTTPGPHPSPAAPALDESQRPHELREHEVRSAVFGVRLSSASGPDHTPPSILRDLWPLIGPRVTHLYRACIRLGHHPQCWKQFSAIVLRKPNKPDYSLPKTYRLIALINSLGKGLELLVARRISFLAENYGLLPKEHMGGRPGRSCEDALLLASSLVKAQWRAKNVVIGLALDAKAAFPSVRKDILLRNLRRRRLPEEIVAFVGSFLENRTCQFIVEGTVSELMDADCGLPQGSPLSPILYIFFNADLLDLFRTEHSTCLGYIDDLAPFVWGKTIEQATERANTLLRRVEGWCLDHKTDMEGSKSHAIVLTHRVGVVLPTALLLHGEQIPVQEQVTFLGATFDQKLNFSALVHKSVSKATSSLTALHILSKTTSGISYRLARSLVISCVLSKLDYLSSLWYVPHGKTAAVSEFDRVQRLATKWITGGFKSAGVDALGFEAFLLPTRLRLERNAFRLAARLHTLPPPHPLSEVVAASRSALATSHRSPLDVILHSYPTLHHLIDLERISPSPVAPWDVDKVPITTIAATKEAAIEQHELLLASLTTDTILLYSDGSLLDDSVGSGMAIRLYAEGEWHWGSQHRGMGPLHTVYAGELEGIRIALAAASTLASQQPLASLAFHILVDNQAAAKGACDPFKGPGQHQRLANRRLYDQLQLNHPRCSVAIHWVPGHEDIEGNERADLLAKEGARLREEGDEEDDDDVREGATGGQSETVGVSRIDGRVGAGGGGGGGGRAQRVDSSKSKIELKDLHIGPPLPFAFDTPKSVSALKAQFNELLQQRWAADWKASATGGRLRDVDPNPPSAHTLRLHDGLPRRISSLLTQLRTSFTHLNSDLFRIRQASSPTCVCGERETRRHFFFECERFFPQRERLEHTVGKKYAFDLRTLLTDATHTEAVARFIKDTNRFPRFFLDAPAEPAAQSRTRGDGRRQ